MASQALFQRHQIHAAKGELADLTSDSLQADVDGGNLLFQFRRFGDLFGVPRDAALERSRSPGSVAGREAPTDPSAAAPA